MRSFCECEGSSEKRVKGVIYVWFVQANRAHKLQPIIKLDIYKTCTLNQRFLWPGWSHKHFRKEAEESDLRFPCVFCGCLFIIARKLNQSKPHDEAANNQFG